MDWLVGVGTGENTPRNPVNRGRKRAGAAVVNATRQRPVRQQRLLRKSRDTATHHFVMCGLGPVCSRQGVPWILALGQRDWHLPNRHHGKGGETRPEIKTRSNTPSSSTPLAAVVEWIRSKLFFSCRGDSTGTALGVLRGAPRGGIYPPGASEKYGYVRSHGPKSPGHPLDLIRKDTSGPYLGDSDAVDTIRNLFCCQMSLQPGG